MYKQIETDKTAFLSNGEEFTPIATLADEYGGRCQISIDDNCYVVKLKGEGDIYVNTNHIFPEAFEVLKKLPSLYTYKLALTPKEKAVQLVDKYFHDSKCNMLSWNEAQECAKIAVDAVIDRLIWHTGASDLGNTVLVDDIKYWTDVKQEIENVGITEKPIKNEN